MTYNLTFNEVKMVAKLLGYTMAKYETFEDAIDAMRRGRESAFQDAVDTVKELDIRDHKTFTQFMAEELEGTYE